MRATVGQQHDLHTRGVSVVFFGRVCRLPFLFFFYMTCSGVLFVSPVIAPRHQRLLNAAAREKGGERDRYHPLSFFASHITSIGSSSSLSLPPRIRSFFSLWSRLRTVFSFSAFLVRGQASWVFSGVPLVSLFSLLKAFSQSSWAFCRALLRTLTSPTVV